MKESKCLISHTHHHPKNNNIDKRNYCVVKNKKGKKCKSRDLELIDGKYYYWMIQIGMKN